MDAAIGSPHTSRPAQSMRVLCIKAKITAAITRRGYFTLLTKRANRSELM